MLRVWYRIAGVVFWFLVTQAHGADSTVLVGQTFPDFALARASGKTWQLSEHPGQPKIVLFWATWCPYCRRLMPGIVRLHDDFSARGLQVVGVNIRDDGDINAYAKRMNIRFDLLLQGDDLARRTGVPGTPTLFVLDQDDRVVWRSSESDPDNPALRAAVTALVAPEPSDRTDR